MGRTVRLLEVPVDLYLAAARHTADLVREFALISYGDRSGVTEHDVPARLLELVDELRHRYAVMTDEIRSRFEEAAAAGDAVIDIAVPAEEAAVDITERMTDLLDAADEFCRSGDLLTLEAPPEIVAWRHWWRDEVVSQVRNGAPPTPWPRAAQS